MAHRLLKYTMTTLLALVVSGTLTCCIDDDLVGICNERQEEDPNTAIVFDISLDVVSGNVTRANSHATEYGDAIDNEVDVEGINHDFRILIFDKEDNFLFEPKYMTDYTLKAIEEGYDYGQPDETGNTTITGNINTKCWQVKIPTNVLEKEGILETMEKDGFKIAVLANWPKSDNTFNRGDKITKLSHYTKDDTYEKSFSYLTNDDNKSLWGASVNWVKNNQSGATAAETFIRNEGYSGAPFNYYKPAELIGEETIPAYNYKHIWRIWNFRGTNNEIDNKNEDGTYLYYRGKEDYRTKWKDINEKWCNKLGISSWATSRFYHGYEYPEQDAEERFGLDFQGNGISYNTTDGCLMLDNFGIGKDDTSSDLYDNDHNAKANVLHFKAFADGTLYIKASATNQNVCLGVQIEANNTGNKDKKTGKSYRNLNVWSLGNTSEEKSYDIVVELNPIDIYIYAIGGMAQIHEIEFIENTYLYDTDRRGRYPGEKGYMIPMYGIQEFSPIGDFLIPGQTLNISTSKDNNSGYDIRKVHLLRSLAKVELLMPESWNPSHVIMRSMNRTCRCEPVDVSTPTNTIWNNVDDEIIAIKNKGVFYDANDEAAENKMKWFYGVWPENKNTATDNNPKIYNCRIQRSDYVYMLKTKIQPEHGYTRYVLYMPEKNIDDPSSVGNWKSNPKVSHMEIRFNDINDDENLEDNDCYRIYFAETQQYKSVPTDRNDPSNYEKDLLGKSGEYTNHNHYPIMRNHIYRFKVNGTLNNSDATINVEYGVCPWNELPAVDIPPFN